MSNIIPIQDMEQQKDFTLMVNDLNLQYFSKKNKKRLCYIKTYGCQQNVADGQKLAGMISDMGYDFTKNINEADFILFNTCAIREHAEDRVFGNVGALKKLKADKPELIIGLCGCMMQQEHVAEKIKKSYPYVSLVFGTHVIYKLPEYIYKLFLKSKRIFDLPQDDGKIAENIKIKRDRDYSAFVSIMYGCDNFCTYCIVPYVRGRERSREPEAILKEVTELAQNGAKEIMLLGQNVNSYGKGLKEKFDFSQLLRKINEISGDFRIRFMTSHPKDANKELIDTIAECKKITNHLHLPFQSGNNNILKMMNRGYTREKYLDTINYAKQKIPGITFTSDIIVGFPGESYEQFLDTLSLVKEIEFTSLFTFIYSRRKGTKAAELTDNIDEKTKSKWFTELLKVQEDIALKNCILMQDKVCEVLVEGYTKKGLLSGRNENTMVVEFSSDKDLIGTIQKVKITDASHWVLKGKIL